jgi:hypothetical protein
MGTEQKIFLATPFYHAENCFQFTRSLAFELPALAAMGYRFRFTPCVGDATHRQRNALAAHFLASDCEWTWLLDSDQCFTAKEAAKFLRTTGDVVVANYPQRAWQWENALGRVFATVDELKSALSAGTVHAIPGATLSGGAVVCTHGGTGCMKIHRRVFEELIKRHLVDKLEDAHMPAALRRWHYRFFEFPCVNGEDRGEDWWFCDLARACGFTIGCDPTVRIGHVGLETYDGLPALNFSGERNQLTAAAAPAAAAVEK